jgi:formiminoglutamase
VVPRFFEGRLPDLNFGTGGGKTADAGLVDRLLGVAAASRFSHVLNGRFKGGYITRAYGQPERGVHAVQLELAQEAYMDEAPPFAWEAERAKDLQAVLRQLLQAGLAWVRG